MHVVCGPPKQELLAVLRGHQSKAPVELDRVPWDTSPMRGAEPSSVVYAADRSQPSQAGLESGAGVTTAGTPSSPHHPDPTSRTAQASVGPVGGGAAVAEGGGGGGVDGASPTPSWEGPPPHTTVRDQENFGQPRHPQRGGGEAEGVMMPQSGGSSVSVGPSMRSSLGGEPGGLTPVERPASDAYFSQGNTPMSSRAVGGPPPGGSGPCAGVVASHQLSGGSPQEGFQPKVLPPGGGVSISRCNDSRGGKGETTPSTTTPTAPAARALCTRRSRIVTRTRPDRFIIPHVQFSSR